MSSALHHFPRRSPDLPQALEDGFASTAPSRRLALPSSSSSPPVARPIRCRIDAADCSIANLAITASAPDAQIPIAI
jgi:hypothetical protein